MLVVPLSVNACNTGKLSHSAGERNSAAIWQASVFVLNSNTIDFNAYLHINNCCSYYKHTSIHQQTSSVSEDNVETLKC